MAKQKTAPRAEREPAPEPAPQSDCCNRETRESNHAPGCPNEPQAEAPAPKRALSEQERRIAESREALAHPLAAGQQFFEAPDGFVIVAEAGRAHVLYRPLHGKEMLINPRREGGR